MSATDFVLTAVFSLAVAALLADSWLIHRWRKRLFDFGRANGYIILSAKRRALRTSPLNSLSFALQVVYRVVVIDPSGKLRLGWAQCRWLRSKHDTKPIQFRWDNET